MILDFSQNGMTLVLEVAEDKSVALKQFGIGTADDRIKKPKWCPLAEVQISGENPDDHHGFKHTGSVGSRQLKYASHRVIDTKNGQRIAILLTDGRIEVTVNYEFYRDIAALRAWTVVKNISDEPQGLEYVSSFAYTGLDVGAPTDEQVRVYIPHNAWVREVDWRAYSLSDLGLSRISSFSSKRIAVSNTGTWSAKEYLPMGGITNEVTHSTALWQIEHNGSWHWEIGEIDKMLYLKLSGPTEQENQWYRELAPGETFESVKVALAVGSDFDGALAEMTKYRRAIFRNNKENAALPVIFNDYMNCLWADPTEEKELPLIDRAAEVGAEYYCMDAGWYADGTWWETVGAWQPVARRFPNGIKRVFDYIRQKGMIPGIWLEIEVMGINCPLAKEFEDKCFFMRHGKRVIDHGRYQLDFRNPKVRDYAMSVIDRVVGEYGVGYIKMDYNIEGGIGTELDADSMGDGLLEHDRAYLAWLDQVLEKYPSLVWENCSSGGMRMDYAMLERAHVQSVTDQTEYTKMAPIAAAAPTAVLPEQSAIWSYPKSGADERVAAFNMVNAMLQRIHLSGKISELSDGALAAVKEGVAVYKKIRREIAAALPFYPLGLPTYKSGWLCLGLKGATRTLLAVWRLNGENDTVEIPVKGEPRLLYPSDTNGSIKATAEGVRVTLPAAYSAVILALQ